MRNAKTKQRIFDTAVRLFAEKGYHVVSVRELSAAAYLNEASLYYYYRDKENVLEEILTEYERRLAGYFITARQVDEIVETATAEQVLRQCARPDRPEESQFMGYAFRIACMEQFTNAQAYRVLTHGLHGHICEGVGYALTRLLELNKIPPADPQAFSLLWADWQLSRMIMRLNSRLPEAGQDEPQQDDGLDFLIRLICGYGAEYHKWPSQSGAALTKRELEVLRSLGQGLTREEIAQSHGISINTVKSMLQNIYGKLGAINSADAVRIAMSARIIQ